MALTVEDYLALITPQHRHASRFVATVAASVQPYVDQQALLASMPAAFDLDAAVGAQLDVVGQWVGRSRFLETPLPNVFFSLGIEGLGFGQGFWKGPYDTTTGLSRLDDDTYRVLLRAKIGANHWDGTLANAAGILQIVFSNTATSVWMQDNEDMTLTIGMVGPPLNLVLLALLTGGYLVLRPVGVRIAYVVQSSVTSTPMFGFGVELSQLTLGGIGVTIGGQPITAGGSGDLIAGFGVGAWASAAGDSQATTQFSNEFSDQFLMGAP